MNKMIRGPRFRKFAAIAAVVALSASIAVSQYNDNYQVNAIQQQVRLRIINENRGSNESVVFDNNGVVLRPDNGRLNRIAGSGRYRSGRTDWRVFNYEGMFNSRTGAISGVMYSWSTDGGTGRPPVGNGKITWGGRIDGTARLTIQQGRVTAREIGTSVPISEMSQNVSQALPRRAVTVSVTRRDGRGRVNVTQQPDRSNNFTAIIEISDPAGGSDYYSLDIDWDNGGGYDPPGGNPGYGDGKMTWTGRVDNTVRITLNRRSARSQEIASQVRVSEVSFNFMEDLPANQPVNVTVRKRDGRGDVRVVSQPSASNRYTAVIEIRDAGSGSDYYSLDVDWDNDGGYRPPGFPGQGGNRQLRWEGYVDDVIEISVQGRDATYRVISGRNPTGVRADFDGRLPRREMEVSVRKIEGRGNIEVVMQPEVYNNYTAVIRITDRQGGADRYAFELDWDRNAVDEDNGGNTNAQLTWSGRVDDVVRLEIQGRNVRGYAMSGQPLSNVRFDFLQSLPRQAVNVTVDRREGRGDVRVIQQPNRFNNFTAIIEVRDTRGGADNYSLDVNW
jgi:hypothetical protein